MKINKDCIEKQKLPEIFERKRKKGKKKKKTKTKKNPIHTHTHKQLLSTILQIDMDDLDLAKKLYQCQ